MSDELTVELFRQSTSRGGGFFQRVETADVYVPSLMNYPGDVPSLLELHTFYPRRIVSGLSGVGRVAFSSGRSKVEEPVVSGASVDVIDFRRNWFPVFQQPCEAVCGVVLSLDSKPDVSVRFDGPCWFSWVYRVPRVVGALIGEVRPGASYPEKLARERIISHTLAGIRGIWHSLGSHSFLLRRVVWSGGRRGARAFVLRPEYSA